MLHDLRSGLRTLARNRGLTAAAIVTLALAIGANTAVFSVLDPLLLRTLPVQNPEQLVLVHAAGPLGTQSESEFAAYELYRNENRVFSGLLATRTVSKPAELDMGGRTESALLELVSGSYFPLLGVHTSRGRLIAPEDDDTKHGSAIAVLSFEAWNRWFGGRDEAVGSHVAVRGIPVTIIGIAPPEFFGVEVGRSPDLYLPLSASQQIEDMRWEGRWVTILGRLKPGISTAAARADLEPLFAAAMRQSNVPAIEQAQVMARLAVEPAARGLDELRDRYAIHARILMAVVAFILLVACANVASLLLALGVARRKEWSVRLALGAGRWRLLRQVITESALLAAAGGALGVLAAFSIHRMLITSLSTWQQPFVLKGGVDARVLTFSLLLLCAATLLSGLAPAWFSTREISPGELKLHTAAGGRFQAGFTSALVVSQAAISVTLLAGTAWLTHSLLNLETVDVGFQKQSVISVMFTTRPEARAPSEVRSLRDQMLERVMQLPGVRSGAFASFAPISGSELGINIAVEGDGSRSVQETHAFFAAVTPGYFATMGVPLYAGRDFTEGDAPGSVAIINRTMARHYFGDRNPIGMRFRFVEGNRPPMEVVGVASDAKYASLRETTPDFLYVPLEPRAILNTTLLVRAAGAAALLHNPIRELMGTFRSFATVSLIATLEEQIGESLHQDRLVAALCTAFSALALTLTGVGMFGMLSFSVARRTSELGVRLALGAEPRDVFRLVAGKGMKLACLGLLLGGAGAGAAASALKGVLFEVQPEDPIALIAVAGFLMGSTILACYVPAHRASRTDPLAALRTE